MSEPTPHPELKRIAQAYARRKPAQSARYVKFVQAEREVYYLRILKDIKSKLAETSLLELGCGSGGELARLISLGMTPEHLAGVELLPERFGQAARTLPKSVRLIQADATNCPFADGTFDVVFLSTVFSSILDPSFRFSLAREAWRLTKPGGAVLIYDFRVSNPRNPDVCGITETEIQRLFPESRPYFQRVTLAPPVGRAVAFLGSRFYRFLTRFPLLRTHVISWICKPASS